MAEFGLRGAGPDDVGMIVALIRRMVADMASHGGHAAAGDAASSDDTTAAIARDLADPRSRFVVAQSSAGNWLGVAGGALAALGGLFAPKETLHISVVYVVPEFRRTGIARALLESLLAWGRAAGASECDLNVLAGNPARKLYETLGFATFQVKMVLPLRAEHDGRPTG
jgi:GNAT superfamily N-acetyltransferase